MSGIAGIFHRDGQPANRMDLGRMVDALARRGPDGQGAWAEGPVGLAHRMFHETPESLNESQPLVDRERQLAVTADARIDNREDLIRRFGLGGEDPLRVSDTRLILLAYDRWGEDCVEHLIGDFAFAVRDGCRRSLFCARDFIGIKPLYYTFRNNRFLFASELRGMLCLDDVPRDLNDEMIVRYLALDFEDREITFYRNVYRLPPAHALRVGRDGLSLRRYWEPDVDTELRLRSDDEYADAFREAFSEAVRCRLRSAFPVGSKLSGGLDSSSITCVARDILEGEGRGRSLRTFSNVFNELPDADERDYINTVIGAGGLEPTLAPMDDVGPLEKYIEGQRFEEYPYLGMNYSCHWRLHREMQAQGVRNVLDGHGGDDTVSHGSFYLTELARGRRIAAWLRESRSAARIWNVPVTRLWRQGLREMAPPFVLALKRGIRAGFAPACEEEPLPIAPALLERTTWRDREKPAAGKCLTLRQSHAGAFQSGAIGFVFEILDKLGYGHSIVTRYPFYDRRLVEFCLSLPPEQKFGGGWGRMVLRRAMDGILPPEIQWRRGKSSLAPHFEGALAGRERPLVLQTLDRVTGRIGDYVDLGALRHRTGLMLEDVGGVARHWRAVWPALTLGIWFADGACRDLGATPSRSGALSEMAVSLN